MIERAPRGIGTENRFWFYANKSNGCWEWRGPINDAGYGILRIENRRDVRAHRYAYELLKGEIPKGFVLDHLCRNRGCVNPDHLEVVTIAENSKRGVVYEQKLAKTHCKRGHAYTDENTYRMNTHSGPARVCRECVRITKRERKEKSNGV